MLARRLCLSSRGPINPRCNHGNLVMVVAARKTLTWGTVAAAVVSALLLACAGSNLPRLAGAAGDPVQAWPLRPGLVGQRNTGANEADTSTHVERAAAPR